MCRIDLGLSLGLDERAGLAGACAVEQDVVDEARLAEADGERDEDGPIF
jgi:hypothetical protein